MSTASPFEAVVSQILEGKATEQVRAAAARGALPLTRAVLTRLYIHLRNDPSEEIRIASEQSLGALNAKAVGEVLEDPTCAPEVLAHFVAQAIHDERLAQKIAFHQRTPGQALLALASGGNATVVEFLLTNQERLLSVPGLLDRLMANPALQADQRGRILEVLERAATRDARAKSKAAASAEAGEEEGGEAEEIARLLSVDVGELYAESEIVDAKEFEQAEDPQIRDAFRRIITLNTAGKAILAMKGGREERMILVRDTNKVVSLGVLRNPRITEAEVETIARMRNVSDEVLRLIGNNREWSKSYSVASALVENPKTPPGVSTNFIGRLNSKDLKNMMRSREIPELIRRMARRTFDQRNQRARSPGSKH